MAANTAFIQIGRGHPNQGGLTPEAILTFSEGDRAAWTLKTFASGSDKENQNFSKIWIPTKEHALEDGLLMAACFLEPEAPIREAIASETHRFQLPRFDVSEGLDNSVHQHLLEQLKSTDLTRKYVVHILDRSYLRSQLGHLYNYAMNLEVTMSVFRREFSSWGNQWFSQGALPITR